MKFHFEADLDYQLEAIEAVCELFRNQQTYRTEFTITSAIADAETRLRLTENDLGIGNQLSLGSEEILQNLNAVQVRNGLPLSERLSSSDFTVEMETGTGKTYVYLRTVFELNKRYGFTKFVIVVPSIAIKEGVHKTLQMTEDHFLRLYSGVPFSYFLYDSAKLGQVRSFASSAQIQIMLVTVGAINKKDVNNLYKDTEKTGGKKPIDLVRATRPILIVDEPQSVDGGLGGRGKEALAAMNPLCTLRYSATHADKHHMVYRLDAVDAYERQLVKQIEIAAATVEDDHNRPYIRLIAVSNKRSAVKARVELSVEAATGARRREVLVQDGDDLERVTKRAVYKGCRIGEIRAARGDEFMELHVPGDQEFLRLGQASGDADALAVQQQMIRQTIREHLDKEKRLGPQGIKVLSLFFIDEVAKYRTYDKDGRAEKGPYARIFEEEYRRLAQHPDYRALFTERDLSEAAEQAHGGYFSVDRLSRRLVNTKEGNQAGREAAEQAYQLIMRDKEKLLSFETPLKFIFSHSALREGWDNPNVFQICTLRDIRTDAGRRQTIGRGLRLCVNQEGDRLRGPDVNLLTVVATESYEEFAENLQREVAEETGFRFGVIATEQFAAVSVTAPDGTVTPLGTDQSKTLWQNLKAEGYIDANGKVQDALRTALKADAVKLADELAPQGSQIIQILRKAAGRLDIRNAHERRTVRLRKEVYLSDDFKSLWDRIKHKTTYRVHFDNEKLMEQCTEALRKAPDIPRTRLQWRTADLTIGTGGVEATERSVAQPVYLDDDEIELPDLLAALQDRTQLTRRTIHRVLAESGRLNEFKRNPQAFIERAAGAINRRKRLAIVDGIKYQRLGDNEYYAQELFEKKELTGYLKNMLTETRKSVYQSVVYDMGTERTFASDLEKNEAVKLYAKLPRWFMVRTPLGPYHPDWAVLVEKDGSERVYLVVETKGSQFMEDLRHKEGAKTECGRAHFKALEGRDGSPRYEVATTVEDLLNAL